MQVVVRVLSYIARKAIILLIAGAFLVFSFLAAMNMANIYMVAKDGMEARVAVALNRRDEADLARYFTQAQLAADTSYRDGRYDDYTIRGYDHRLEFDKLFCWPWATTASVTVREWVRSIDGELPVALQTDEQLKIKEKIPPPDWPAARYEVFLRLEDGNWMIAALQKLEDLPQPTPTPPRPTPAFIPTPSPATATPRPSATPAPSVTPGESAR